MSINAILKFGAKALKTAPTVTRKVHGIPVTTNLLTGTKVVKANDGIKTVVLGEGNRLANYLGKGTSITSYPKGSFFGGSDGLIVLKGEKAKGFMPMSYNQFGDFVKLLKDLAKCSV